jgi:serine protease Do
MTTEIENNEQMTSGADAGQENITEPAEAIQPAPEAEPAEAIQPAPEAEPAPAPVQDAAPSEAVQQPQIPVPAPEAPEVWSFAAQAAADRKASRRSRAGGAVIYSITVTVLFLICFGALAFIIIRGFVGGSPSGEGPSRTIFIRRDDGTNGVLTVAEIASKVRSSTVGITAEKSSSTSVGTGIVMSDDGYILTNYHVVDKAGSISVLMEDGARFEADYIGGDEISDVALIKIAPGSYKLTPAEFADSDAVITGEQVVAIGNPSGLDYFGTVTVGYISAVRDNLKIYDENGLVEKKMKMLQTDAALNPGNSGGPLCDMTGKVIGINTMKLVDEYDGIGFAIPINGALTIADEIKRTGSYSGTDVAEKGVSLGIQCMAAKKDVPLQISASETYTPAADGVLVVGIINDSSSAYGYLRKYDIIQTFDGKTVNDVDSVKDLLDRHHTGDTVTMTVFRDGKTETVSFVLK